MRDYSVSYIHKKLDEEVERIVKEAKEQKDYVLTKKQASRLAAEKSKRGKMTWDEGIDLLAKEGSL